MLDILPNALQLHMVVMVNTVYVLLRHWSWLLCQTYCVVEANCRTSFTRHGMSVLDLKGSARMSWQH